MLIIRDPATGEKYKDIAAARMSYCPDKNMRYFAQFFRCPATCVLYGTGLCADVLTDDDIRDSAHLMGYVVDESEG